MSHWLYAKRMIVELNLDPKFWADEADQFYDYFAKRKSSPEYISMILRVLNLWGFFIARKLDRAFIPIPPPTGTRREMIRDEYLESPKKKKTSAPLLPDVLRRAEAKLLPSQYMSSFVQKFRL